MPQYNIGDRVRLASTREIEEIAHKLGVRSVYIARGLKIGDEGVVVSNGWNSPEHDSLFEVRFTRTNETVVCNAAMVSLIAPPQAPPQPHQWTYYVDGDHYYCSVCGVKLVSNAYEACKAPLPPQWTNGAPTEPGWYWFHWDTSSALPHLRVYRILPGGYVASARESEGYILASQYGEHYGKWWPVRIEEPKEEA